MAQASVTGRNGTQIALHIHGHQLPPLNINASRTLWHQLGEALQTAEHNRGQLIGPPVELDAGETGVEASVPSPIFAGFTEGPDLGHSPEETALADRPDVVAAEPQAAPVAAAEQDFSAMTKKRLAAWLDERDVDFSAAAKKAELVKLAREQ